MDRRVADFMAQLLAEGLSPELRHDVFVVFDYEVVLGKHAGELVKLALQVPADWPATPPTGPFVSPRLLPINASNGRGRPWDAVHEAAPRGLADPDGRWEYWSRPYLDWEHTDKSVKAYLRHLLTLFDEIKLAEDDQAEAA
jgi:hypothetical protein